MSYKRIEIEGNRALSQQLFQKVVETVPVDPDEIHLMLTVPEARRGITVKRELFNNFRRGCLPLLLSAGYQIEFGTLKFYSHMQSGVDFVTHLRCNQATLRIAKNEECRIDLEGKIGEWWNGLEEKFKQKALDQPTSS